MHEPLHDPPPAAWDGRCCTTAVGAFTSQHVSLIITWSSATMTHVIADDSVCLSAHLGAKGTAVTEQISPLNFYPPLVLFFLGFLPLLPPFGGDHTSTTVWTSTPELVQNRACSQKCILQQ
jgi:hypothetical protein